MRHMLALELKTYLHAVGEQLPLLLDVREPWEFEICHLVGSRLLPMRQIPHQLTTLELHRETVLICHHGIRSGRVGYYLEGQGFTNLINLTGGLAAWAREVDPAMRTY